MHQSGSFVDPQPEPCPQWVSHKGPCNWTTTQRLYQPCHYGAPPKWAAAAHTGIEQANIALGIPERHRPNHKMAWDVREGGSEFGTGAGPEGTTPPFYICITCVRQRIDLLVCGFSCTYSRHSNARRAPRAAAAILRNNGALFGNGSIAPLTCGGLSRAV